MKKLIILFVIIGLLTSCGIQNIEKNYKQTEKKINIEVNEWIEKNNINFNNKNKLSFNKIEEKIIKLKELNLSEDELMFLNDELENILNRNIEELALEKNDYNICDKSRNSSNCKKKLILKNQKINDCKILVDTWSIISCQNDINEDLAEKNLDETFCDKIIDDSEELFEVNNCKNNIFIEKARKTQDIKICNKITEKIEKEMCIDSLKN